MPRPHGGNNNGGSQSTTWENNIGIQAQGNSTPKARVSANKAKSGSRPSSNSLVRPQEVDRGSPQERPDVRSQRPEFRFEMGAEGSNFDQNWFHRRRFSR